MLDSGFRLSGRVTDASAPAVGVPGINVTAQPAAPGGTFYGTQTHADGTYSVLVSAGTYRISFFTSYPDIGQRLNTPRIACRLVFVRGGAVNEPSASRRRG